MKQADDSIDDDAPTQVFKPRVSRVSAARAVVNDDRLWDVNDVARYLQVSKSWVYHRAESGQLPHRRIGGLLRFEPDRIRDLR